MTNNVTSEAIYEQTAIIVSQALMIKPSVITPSSRLFSDLGAESIDLLDIRFRIEKQFAFKIEDGEMIKSLGQDLDRDLIDKYLTVKSIADFVEQRLQANV